MIAAKSQPYQQHIEVIECNIQNMFSVGVWMIWSGTLSIQIPCRSNSIQTIHPRNWVKKPPCQGVVVCATCARHFAPQFNTSPTARSCLFTVVASQTTQPPWKHVPKWCFQNQVGSYEILRYQNDLRPLKQPLLSKWPTGTDRLIG